MPVPNFMTSNANNVRHRLSRFIAANQTSFSLPSSWTLDPRIRHSINDSARSIIWRFQRLKRLLLINIWGLESISFFGGRLADFLLRAEDWTSTLLRYQRSILGSFVTSLLVSSPGLGSLDAREFPSATGVRGGGVGRELLVQSTSYLPAPPSFELYLSAVLSISLTTLLTNLTLPSTKKGAIGPIQPGNRPFLTVWRYDWKLPCPLRSWVTEKNKSVTTVSIHPW